MSLDRSRHAPITCKYNSAITKDHENRHFPVILDVTVATGKFDMPTVTIQGSTAGENAVVYGELLEVNTGNETCSVQPEGLMYLRAKAAYAMADNGKPVALSDTADQVKLLVVTDTTSDVSALINAAIGGAPKVEGGFTITESGSDINIYKCRK